MLHATLAPCRQAEQVSTTDAAGVRAERERLDDMRTPPHAAVTDDE